MLSLCHRCTSFPENGNKKTLTLAGARGNHSSRYHPGLLTPRGINLDECYENRLSNTPACNGTNRLDLLPQWRFNLQLRDHFQRWCGIDFSASSTLCSRPWRLLVLFKVIHVILTGKVPMCSAIKKPL